MRNSSKENRNKVFISAYNKNNQKVEYRILEYDNYYENSSELIDSSAYRANKGIIKIIGKIYNSSGELQLEFYNRYSENGEYIGSKAIHADGTIVED